MSNKPDDITELEQAYWEGRAEAFKEVQALRDENRRLRNVIQIARSDVHSLQLCGYNEVFETETLSKMHTELTEALKEFQNEH